MEKCGTKSGKTTKQVKIKDCGQLWIKQGWEKRLCYEKGVTFDKMPKP